MEYKNIEKALKELKLSKSYIIHTDFPTQQDIFTGDQIFHVAFINDKFYTYYLERGVLVDVKIVNTLAEVKQNYIDAVTY